MNTLILSSIAVALAGLLVAFVLRRFKIQAPLLHRIAWGTVLVQGILFAGIPLKLPVLDPATVNHAEVATDPRFANPTAATAAGADLALSGGALERSGPSPAPLSRSFGETLTSLWLAGLAVTLAIFALSYGSLLFALRRAPLATGEWAVQWRQLLAAHRIRKPVPLLVHQRLGPMLCRLPRGCAVVIPEATWRNLTAAQRGAVLEHEIAHIRRGDLWKTFAARMISALHWFNPVAWLAARQFEEAAEWACDRRLAERGETRTADYARALLKLAKPQSLPIGASLARGAAISPRIERLVRGAGRRDPAWKTLSFLLMMIAVALIAALRIELVAQEARTLPGEQFKDELNRFAGKLGENSSLAAFRSLLGTPAGTIVMKDRAVRIEEQLRQEASDTAIDDYIAAYFEESGDGKLRLREGREAYRDQLFELHRTFGADVEQLVPPMRELAGSLDAESEAAQLMARFLTEDGAAPMLYMIALQKKTRPDAEMIAGELGNLLTSDGKGGLEIPPSRFAQAQEVTAFGRKLMALSDEISREFSELSAEFAPAKEDDLGRRLKELGSSPAFAAFAAFESAPKHKENKPWTVSAVADRFFDKLEESLEESGDGLRIRKDSRAKFAGVIAQFDALMKNSERLRGPLQDLSDQIRPKDDVHRAWKEFTASDVGLVAVAGNVDAVMADPGAVFKAEIGKVLETGKDGKVRIRKDDEAKVAEEIQKMLRGLRDVRRKGREFDRLAERLADEDLAALYRSSLGKLIVAQAIRRDIENAEIDGLGTWIDRFFKESEGGALVPKSGAGEEIDSVLADAAKIGKNLKPEF